MNQRVSPRDRIDAISNASASTASLITLALPPDYALGEMLEQVEEDHAELAYLDTEATDRAVQTAVERTRNLLQRLDGVPDTGLLAYVGVDETGETVEYVFDDLPTPVENAVYARDHAFDTEPLDTTVSPDLTYGLLVVERGGAALGRFDGHRVTAVETLDSDVMGKTRAGGQSADRFERRRAEQKSTFFDAVAAEAKRQFLDEEPVDGVLVGGTTVTVDEFLDGDYLDHRLSDRVVGDSFSVDHASERGLRELVERARDQRDEFEHRPAERALDRFLSALGNDDPVAYGRDEVDRALTFDAVDTLLLSGGLSTADRYELEERVQDEGGECVVVPADFDRGERFAEAFDGIGALLRFPIE